MKKLTTTLAVVALSAAVAAPAVAQQASDPFVSTQQQVDFNDPRVQQMLAAGVPVAVIIATVFGAGSSASTSSSSSSSSSGS
ncbi:MAG: hypothetical protein RIG84_13385 [Roseovarius sp.]|jgi:acid phosphatase class B